ncbi:TPA: DUF4113 domain-containing protein [Vibrio mimicus]
MWPYRNKVLFGPPTDTFFLAAQGITQKWAMRRDMLTPQYTTCW